ASPPPALVDTPCINTTRPILFPVLRQASYRKRLWLLAGGVALYLATVFASQYVKPAASGPANGAGTFGLDFIAFYTGGSFAREGRAAQLYNLSAVQSFERSLARRYGVELGGAMGPWWNPPFYAWVFAPLSYLPFRAASDLWIGINVACAAAAAWQLRRMLPRDVDWRTWALIPTGIAL